MTYELPDHARTHALGSIDELLSEGAFLGTLSEAQETNKDILFSILV